MKLQYTGNNITKHFGQPQLKLFLYELNIIADAMENHLGVRYTTHLINCHRHHKCVNSVCKSTINPEFLRLQPKRTKIQKIHQDTMNKGKWKEERRRKKKQWLNVLEYVGINSRQDSLDQVELQMDSNTIYYFKYQTWSLALHPAQNISKLTIQLL